MIRVSLVAGSETHITLLHLHLQRTDMVHDG